MRLIAYYVIAAVCAAFVVTGKITQNQADTLSTQITGLLGVVVGLLAAKNVDRQNLVTPAETGPVEVPNVVAVQPYPDVLKPITDAANQLVEQATRIRLDVERRLGGR